MLEARAPVPVPAGGGALRHFPRLVPASIPKCGTGSGQAGGDRGAERKGAQDEEHSPAPLNSVYHGEGQVAQEEPKFFLTLAGRPVVAWPVWNRLGNTPAAALPIQWGPGLMNNFAAVHCGRGSTTSTSSRAPEHHAQ